MHTQKTQPLPQTFPSLISMIQHPSWSHATVLKHCSAAQRGSAGGWVDAPAQEVGADPYPHGAHLACLPKNPPPTKKPSAVPKGEGGTTLGLENSSLCWSNSVLCRLSLGLVSTQVSMDRSYSKSPHHNIPCVSSKKLVCSPNLHVLLFVS